MTPLPQVHTVKHLVSPVGGGVLQGNRTFRRYGGLNENGPHMHVGSETFKKCGLVGGSVFLKGGLEKLKPGPMPLSSSCLRIHLSFVCVSGGGGC